MHYRRLSTGRPKAPGCLQLVLNSKCHRATSRRRRSKDGVERCPRVTRRKGGLMMRNNTHARVTIGVLAAAAAALGLGSVAATAAEWKPTRPIEFNGAAGPGGG